MIIQSILLGLIQGFTEFLPVSSSGHLILAADFLGQTINDLSFDAVIHLATLLAMVVALWADIKTISLGMIKKTSNGRVGWQIILATIPVLVIGFFASNWLEKTFRSPLVVVVSLAVWGIVLWLADFIGKNNSFKNLNEVGWKKSLIIGALQIIALIPGTSRSGIAITAGLFSGLSRETAARFSFLIGIPSIAAAGGYSFLKIILSGGNFDWLLLILAFISAFVSGFLAIKFLLQLMRGVSYKWFAIYRILLAVILLMII
jgi:undecaprenyl-diphosphatase